MEIEPYTFADLDKREDLLKDIKRFESLLKQELGKEVTLIAYTMDDEN